LTEGKCGNVSSVEWQATLRDPVCHVMPSFHIFGRPIISTSTGPTFTKYATVAVDERSEVSFSINRGTLAWQPILVGFVGFYPYNGVSVLFARWLRTTRSASAALDAGKPIN